MVLPITKSPQYYLIQPQTILLEETMKQMKTNNENKQKN